jgi:hypothetical protein
MNREDIIRMAREAGFGFMIEKPKSATHMQCGIDDLERFAALVAAAEREELLKLCELPEYSHQYVHTFKRVIRARSNP